MQETQLLLVSVMCMHVMYSMLACTNVCVLVPVLHVCLYMHVCLCACACVWLRLHATTKSHVLKWHKHMAWKIK